MRRVSVPRVTEERDAQDEGDLRKLGYAQQLRRAMGGFSNFALSFSVISILTGAVTLYGDGLKNGGPLVMSVGWPLVTLLTLPIAASLAELASAYPTAGALYHWASILGGPSWGFFTAWLNTLGQFAITAGIDYGVAVFLAPMLGFPADRQHVLSIYAIVLTSHAVLNHVGVRAVSILNIVSAWWHVFGVLLLVVALAFAPRHPIGFLFERFTTQPRGYGYGFAIGLLQAAFTFTGYDASAHVGEETHDPRRNAPRGIFWSVVVSGVAGLVMLLMVTIAIPDLPSTLAADNAFIDVLVRALGQRLGAVLLWIVIAAMWFAGLSSVTSNSRMLFAFARDGGLPFSSRIALVSKRFRTPHVAVWVSVVAAFTLAWWAKAYNAVVALSTIALYASYALPIVALMRARRRGRTLERGPWHLGRWSTTLNALAVSWVAVATVLFVLPPNELAGITFFGALVALTLYWFLYMRSRFAGPRLALLT